MIGNATKRKGPAHRWARRHNLDVGVTFAGMLPYELMLRRVLDERRSGVSTLPPHIARTLSFHSTNQFTEV
jgi:hypothetical protein